MATVDKNSQMNVKTSNGDIVKIYPNTKIANVDGLQTALNGKVDAVTGKGLSTNDYTTTEKNKLAGIAAGATANIGTVTQVKVGSTAYNPSSGVVSLPAYPTTLPASDVSSWAKASSKPSYTASEVGAIATTAKGAASGVAELDANGKVPSSQLPAYVDDVLEYTAKSSFPTTGETGKIYVDTTTNLTYRWSGSAYVEISPSLALGTTSSTAYRGDRGNTAYSHATDSSRLTTAQSSGLYKIATTAQGHIASVTAVAKSDITGLGIPGSDTNTHRPIQVNGTQVLGDNTTALNLKAGSNVSLSNSSGTVTIAATDTTYSAATQSANGLMSSTDKTKLDGIATGATANIGTVTQVKVGSTAYNPSSGVVSLPAYPTTLPASDVSSWAKQSTKPSYTYSEVGAAPASHNHYQITTIGDYRSIATKPDDYPNLMQFKGLKNNSAIGNPSSDTYSYVLGLRGWSDSSGGNSHEFAFNDSGIFTRSGASTTWGSWSKLAKTSDIPTSLPASDVYSWAKASTKPSYTYSEVGAAASSHTHNYAGSSSAGGVATSAAKLSNTSKIGDTNKPVYFKADGTPAAISYTIDKSVPSNAVFTDTTYSAATQSAAGLMSAADKAKLDGVDTGANKYVLTSSGITTALGYTPANNDGVNQALNTRVQSRTYAYTTSATSKVRIYKTANRGVILAIYGSQGGTGKQSTILVLDVQSGILSVRRLSMGGNSEVVDSVTVNDYSTYSEMVVTLTVANSSWPPVIIPLMQNDNVPQIEVL